MWRAWRRDMQLRYVVITSVNRDDLADGGSHAFRRDRARSAARAARGARRSADAGFLRRSGCRGARARCRPARLQSQHGDRAAAVPRGCARRPTTGSRSTCWRSRAGYRAGRADQIRLHGGAGRDGGRSATRCCAICAPPDADVATIGQYLQPTRRNLPVAEYIEPRAVRRVSRLRPVARIQDGVQRPAGAQFVHGGDGERRSPPHIEIELALALASAAFCSILTFPRFNLVVAGAGGARAAAGGGGARAAAAAALPAGLDRRRGLLVRRLLLDPVRALVSRRLGDAGGLGRCSCCSAWPRRCTWACSACSPAC